MAEIGDLIVRSARGWIGTPYRHQASCRGAGADCLGLVRGIWREVYGGEPEAAPSYTADWGEASNDERLWKAACRHLSELRRGDDWETGQLLLFRMRSRGLAKHLAVLAASQDGRASFIHAMSDQGVVESALSDPWRRRIAARFAFPDKE